MPTTYAILLPGDETAWEALSPDDQAAVFAQHDAFTQALEARGHRVSGGAELTHSRETKLVRRIGEEVVVTAGPYAESVEQLSGFYLVESDDLDDLVQCAAMLADEDGAVEVRACKPGGEA